jgi:hypothetical protein
VDFGKHGTTPLYGIYIVSLIDLLNGLVKWEFFLGKRGTCLQYSYLKKMSPAGGRQALPAHG